MRYFSFLVGFILEKFGKVAVFLGGYGYTLVRRLLPSDGRHIDCNKDSFIDLEQVNNPGSDGFRLELIHILDNNCYANIFSLDSCIKHL